MRTEGSMLPRTTAFHALGREGGRDGGRKGVYIMVKVCNFKLWWRKRERKEGGREGGREGGATYQEHEERDARADDDGSTDLVHVALQTITDDGNNIMKHL